MLTEKEKELRRKYQKTHREMYNKHNKSYRMRHPEKLDEYKRLNPEVRFRVPLETLKRLKAIPGGIRGLIDRELTKVSVNKV
jgi:hypothetical protein